MSVIIFFSHKPVVVGLDLMRKLKIISLRHSPSDHYDHDIATFAAPIYATEMETAKSLYFITEDFIVAFQLFP